MADSKKDEASVEQSDAGVDMAQVKPADDMSASELKDKMVYEDDKDLGATKEPSHPADKTSAPNVVKTKVNNPPWNTGRPDEPVLQSAVLGAGAHEPPDPDEFDAEGRPYTEANPKP